ncbi:MAG: tyrosine-protein phosphatase [Planctomycetota bacterium]
MASDNMIRRVNEDLSAPGKADRQRFAREGYIDIHCHCLPAVDDGPATKHEALALCQLLVDDGITTVIATPHQLGRFYGCNQAAEVRESVSMFNKELETHRIPLTVVPGGDVRLDERICQLLETDKILTLADGGRYILLELPSEVFIDIEPLLVELARLDVQVIISHPERNSVLIRKSGALLKWLSRSAHLQVTAASLLGEFGPMAQRAAWRFLSLGWASFVATDCHNSSSRRPRMKAVFKSISKKLGQATARWVCIENPLRVLKGQDVLRRLAASTRMCTNETAPNNF